MIMSTYLKTYSAMQGPLALLLCLLALAEGLEGDGGSLRKLQQAEEEGSSSDETPAAVAEPTTTKTPVIEKSREPESGPLSFYDGQFFSMRVRKPIRISVFSEDGSKAAVFLLSKAAASVKGSMIKAEERYLVNLDWKGVDLSDNGLLLQNIFLKMEFIREKKEYRLVSMAAESVRIGSTEIVLNPLAVKSDKGYKVKAPIGTSFCCYDPGMFPPASNETEVGRSSSGKYRVGVTLPGVQLQVFKLSKSSSFGPEWNCANILSIGLWVTLLITFGFALVCYWGFSMLANINTMDRFDDPKGKPLIINTSD